MNLERTTKERENKMKVSALYKTIEDTVKKIRKLAYENTELFLGIGGWIAPVGAVVAAVIMYCVNLAVYCYEVGYYYFGFNVPVSLIEEPRAASLPTSVIGCFLLVVVLLIAALVGRWAYRKRKYLLSMFVELLVISVAILCPMLPSLVGMNGVEATTSIVTLLLLAIFITLLLNVFSLNSLVFPSKEDVLARKKEELKGLVKKIDDTVANKKKQAKYEKKRETVENRIDKLEQQTEGEKKVTPKEVVKEALVMILITIFIFLIAGIPACLSTGINEVMQKDELTLVMNAEEVDDQFREIFANVCEINGLAIIYENEDGLLVSPCYISNGEAVVYTNFQQFIDAEGLIIYKNTYENIIPKTVALLFDNVAESDGIEVNSAKE